MKIEEIQQLEKEEHELSQRLDKIRTALYLARVESALKSFSLESGKTILKDRRGREWRFAGINSIWHGSGKPWVNANKKLKGGGFGPGKFNLYSDWEVVT